MVGTWRLLVCVVVTSFLMTSSASAFNGRFGFWRPPTVSSFYVAPIYCPPMPTVVPVPDASRPPLAKPTAAPPSPTAEPPLPKGPAKASNDPRMPVIVTSHALASGIASKTSVPKDRCRVGFWNLSGRVTSVVIEGKTWTLPKDGAVTLELDRQFTWQVGGQLQHVERVPDSQTSLEVLIRE